MTAAPGKLVPALRTLVLGCTVALIAIVTAWLLLVSPTALKAGVAVAITAPAWLALRGLAAGNRRTYAWTTLVVVPYFVLAVTEAVASPVARLWACACLVAAFVLFVLLIAYLRVTRPL